MLFTILFYNTKSLFVNDSDKDLEAKRNSICLYQRFYYYKYKMFNKK